MSELTFKRFGTQIDCSRNAVMNVESIKKWIDLVAAMGHNTLMMYTEDTYEVDGHPYFGYGRDRLTREEMKEINAYGAERGIELIPSINTLAHMGTIFRWKPYAEIHDCEDIMLCDDERTYELIDAMFRTLSECYTSKVVNVGMDEAGMLGRGKYYDAHGDARRIDIIYRHLQKVAEIAKKYGKELLIYSDMFYSLATHAEYSDEKAQVVEEVATQIPDNVSLVYWNYYKRTVEDYSAIMNVHRQIKPEGLWYYGGTWNWFSFNPENSYGIAHLSNAIKACQNTGVENMIISMWGDDGGECGRFASLPAVFWATELAKGNTDEADIKKKFEKLVGVPFDQFILLDLTSLGETERYGSHPSRYILYNDPKWGYMFETMHDLCAVAAEKCDIGTRIREVTCVQFNQLKATDATSDCLYVDDFYATELTAPIQRNTYEIGFADVKQGDWYYDAVNFAVDNSIMSGYNASKFGPNDTLNRTMVVQVLYNKEGQPALNGMKHSFSDVPAAQWFNNAVTWGSNRGVVSGFGGGVFKPEDAVTIEQVAVILWNYSHTPAGYGALNGLGGYSDWAANALRWAVDKGLLEGVPFKNATEKATRAQTAQILTNYLRNV